MKLPIGIALSVAVVALLAPVGGCTPAAMSTGVGVATVAVDIAGAVCEELPQGEPAWVTFSCSIVDAAGGKKTFLARVPASSASTLAELRARRCAPGKVSP